MTTEFTTTLPGNGTVDEAISQLATGLLERYGIGTFREAVIRPTHPTQAGIAEAVRAILVSWHHVREQVPALLETYQLSGEITVSQEEVQLDYARGGTTLDRHVDADAQLEEVTVPFLQYYLILEDGDATLDFAMLPQSDGNGPGPLSVVGGYYSDWAVTPERAAASMISSVHGLVEDYLYL